MAEDTEELETVKYYTRARKFPQLLGRMPDGTKIPGGPYTVQQLLAAIAIIVIGGLTIGTWGVFGSIGNVAVLFGLVFGVVFVIGRLPVNGRNPLFALIGLYRTLNAPATGRYQGKPVRFRRPRRVRHQVNVYLGSLPGTEPWAGIEPGLEPSVQLPAGLRHRLDRSLPVAELEPAAEPEPEPATGPLSGVQALLALVPGDDGDRSGGSGGSGAQRGGAGSRSATRRRGAPSPAGSAGAPARNGHRATAPGRSVPGDDGVINDA